ncbi:hypothetical protein [Paenibacillus polymyxa]|uniref:hypothetical protein n=1 Tax=Paenibacillus polymyxa TaxID=1406 RepID=UPI00192BAB4B|nr:hypothetical protein [Paenibacillus polymyxa]
MNSLPVSITPPLLTPQEGVGNGLFLAREIIAAESGYIEVRYGHNYGLCVIFSILLSMDT